ncbi:MAG TPA: aminotransferase class III-fold pyridoxal phosphate-dependent enzyme, partial [Gemmatimonadaceae bacterium]|nr:aminotransferase class III-fold pyridoxal phosphate-dependent enzyme [Gemmatimonadaceae bacterium]
IAAINATSQCVVSGPTEVVEAFRATLEGEGVLARPLRTSHAFHSAMMDPVLPAFGALVADVALSPPTLPIISTVTGRLLDPSTATDRAYWTRHLRETVRFADAMATAVQVPSAVYLELGPAATLSSLARRVSTTVRVVPSLDGTADEPRAMARAAAQLWCWGAARAWPDRPPPLAPLSLPSYPFERSRCWVEAPAADVDAPRVTDRAGSPPPIVSPASPSTPHAPASPMSDQPRSTDRPLRLAREVLALVEDVAGLPVRDADPAARFTALGLDSLVLTQLALAVSRRYGVKVAFRQLLEALPSAADLAAHLDGALPADPVDTSPAADTPPRTVTVDAPATGGATATPVVSPVMAPLMSSIMPIATGALAAPTTDGVAAVIAQQLQVMQQQLALLTGGAVAQAAASAPSAVAPTLETTTPNVPTTPPVEVVSAPATQPAATEAPDGPAVGPNRGVYDATKAFGAAMRVTVTDHSDTLSPRQRARLDAFIRRYTARTAGSKRYTATHRDGMADPRAVTGFRPLTKELVYPIVVERSRGARVWDIDGNEYIDVLSGFGSNLLGWTPDVVTDALRAQLDRGFEVGPQHVLAGEVADRFRALTGAERVAFCNTGSEAVLGAIRIARTVTGRPLVAMFSGAYHGINDEVIVRPRPDGRAMPAAPGILPEATRNALVLDWANPESLRVLESRADEIAAVLVEPVQSRRPDLQPREFLTALRELTARTGIVFIWDEIVTGFRAAPGGAQELFGIRGDLATYGKIVGGGFPIGVIAGKREFMDALDGGPWQYGDASVPEVGVTYFAGTFVRHPLALAAARAMLDELARQGPALQDTLAARTTAVAEAINARALELGAPVQVRHFRSVWKTFLTADTPHGDLFFYALRERGLHIYDGFPCFMTAAHGDAECAAIVDAFAGAMEEMLEGRFLPRVRVEDAITEAVGSEPPSATRTAWPARPAHTA